MGSHKATRLEELYLAAVEEQVENRLRKGGDVQLMSELDAEAAATLARPVDATGEVGEAGVRAAVLEQRARLVLARGQHAEEAALLVEADALRQDAHRPRSALETRDVEETAPGLAITSVARDLPTTGT